MTPSANPPYRIDATGSDIHGEATALRDRGPATPVLLPGDIPAWTVTDPNLIRRLLTHQHISKDAHQHWSAYRKGQVPETWPLRLWTDVRNALTAYGPEHRRLRRPLATAFSTRRIRALTPQIHHITDTLLDQLATTHPNPGQVTDVREHFAWRLPLLVVNSLLGVNEGLHDDFRDATGDLFATDLSPDQATAARAHVYDLINELINLKRTSPADDVTSTLIHAHNQGELTDAELADSLVLLIGAGHETTVNLLDHGITNLLAHPDQLALLHSGQATWDQVVEEGLRHQAPIANIILRFAVQDIIDEPTKLTIPAGDALVINYAAANRDPAVHGPTASSFDITRQTRRDHLAFGHGAHLCVGAELARVEARIAFETAFTRFPHMRLALPADQLRPLPSFISNGHETLPIILNPTVT